MEFTTWHPSVPGAGSGFSVVLTERVLRTAQTLGLADAWARLPLGNPSRRRTAYRPQQRIAALLSGLAAGLKGIAPGNSVLRPNTALQGRLGGRFPDQGTIHRWLDQVTAPQAAALRNHLHQTARSHGRFWQVLYAGRYLTLDIDGQGLVARANTSSRRRWAIWARASTGVINATSATPGTRAKSSTSSWPPATAR